MSNPITLEAAYHEFIEHLPFFLPDGVIEIDLKLLHENKILSPNKKASSKEIKHYFHIIETPEKITLFNDDYVVWIAPQKLGDRSLTLTLVAKLMEEKKQPELELAFSSRGVYNTSQIVLQVLEHFLEEINENDKMLESISKGEE